MVLRRKAKVAPNLNMYDNMGRNRFCFHSENSHDAWEVCRETLSNDLYRYEGSTKNFFFTGSPQKYARLIEFLETSLNIKRCFHSGFYPVVYPKKPNKMSYNYWYDGPTYQETKRTLTYIVPSSFWKAYRVRIEFLTAILKGAHYAKGRDYLGMILGSRYLKSTARATGMFLTGHTLPTNHNMKEGWVWSVNKAYPTHDNDTDAIKKINQSFQFPKTVHACRFFRRGKPGHRLVPMHLNRLRKWVNDNDARGYAIAKESLTEKSPFSQ